MSRENWFNACVAEEVGWNLGGSVGWGKTCIEKHCTSEESWNSMYHVEVQGGHRRNHCWWYELRMRAIAFRALLACY